MSFDEWGKLEETLGKQKDNREDFLTIKKSVENKTRLGLKQLNQKDLASFSVADGGLRASLRGLAYCMKEQVNTTMNYLNNMWSNL